MGHPPLDDGVLDTEQVTDGSLEHSPAFLAGLRFCGLDLDCFAAVVVAAGGAGVVRSLRAVALRAVDQSRRVHPEMAAPLSLACLGGLSFRQGHCLLASSAAMPRFLCRRLSLREGPPSGGRSPAAGSRRRLR